jgi:hypothetical protein
MYNIITMLLEVHGKFILSELKIRKLVYKNIDLNQYLL